MARIAFKPFIGRPSKITDEELKKTIYEYVSYAPYSLAAPAAGIAYSTFCEWMNLGEAQFKLKENERDEKYKLHLEFFVRVRESQAKRPIEWVKRIEAHTKKHWQAAAWLCERLHPNEYSARKDELEKKVDDTLNDLKEIKEMLNRCKSQGTNQETI